MNPLKQKKCASCPKMFVPSSRLQKTCSMACTLDDIEKKGVDKYVKAKEKEKKPKPKTVGKLRLLLWDELSLYIKLLYSKDGQWCECYTCDRPIQIGTINCQGGHAFSKAANGNLYFDERAIRPQCSYCNCGEEGNHYIFNERLKQEIGIAAWTDMYENRKQLFKKPRSWYEEKIQYYKAEIEQLRKLKNASQTM